MTKHAELVKYGLRSARKPRVINGLSNLLTVVKPEGLEFHRIGFSDEFVTAVGNKLPQGLHHSTPSAVAVVELASGWMVVCYYIARPNRYHLLWKTDTLPAWAGGQGQHEIHSSYRQESSPRA